MEFYTEPGYPKEHFFHIACIAPLHAPIQNSRKENKTSGIGQKKELYVIDYCSLECNHASDGYSDAGRKKLQSLHLLSFLMFRFVTNEK